MALIGVDVSKRKLDVAWLREPKTRKVKTRSFANDENGIERALGWLLEQTKGSIGELHVLMEATGIYHEKLAYAAYRAGAQVYVVNPAKTNHFAKSFGPRSKTDRKDSVMLAQFLDSRTHQLWQPEPVEVRHLRALLGRLEALEKDIRREQNRYEKAQVVGDADEVMASIDTVLDALVCERDRLRREIDNHIDHNERLKNDRALLKTIPGIGRVLSAELLAVLRSRNFVSANQSAAFIGLVPLAHRSGDSVDKPPRLSKTGSSRLRAKLYMAAVVAIRSNPLIREQYSRLRAHGKSKMSALGAAMRKLVQIGFGVLKHQTEFCPQGAN